MNKIDRCQKARKVETKTFLIGKGLKTQQLTDNSGGTGNRMQTLQQEIKRIVTTLLTPSYYVYQ